MKPEFSRLSGFTLLELLVAMSISLLLLLFVSRAAVESQSYLKFDAGRNKLSSNHRSIFESLGGVIRGAGAGLPEYFPALVLQDRGSPELVIRSSYLPEVSSLVLCNDLPGGAVTAPIVGREPTLGTCPLASSLEGSVATLQRRLSEAPEGTIKGYVLNRATNVGEFFDISSVGPVGSDLVITRGGGGSWSQTYPASSSAIFFVTEVMFRRSGKYIEMFKDGDYNKPLRVAGGVDTISISIDLVSPTATAVTRFDALDNWKRIRSVNVSIESRSFSPVRGLSLSRTSTSSFYPRNVVSKF